MRPTDLFLTLSFVCGLAAAVPPASSAPVKAADLAGRWHNDRIWMISSRSPECSGEEGCGLTLDIVACGASWCGIEVGKDGACGAVALKFDGGSLSEAANVGVKFEGTLELARGTEPYVIQAYMRQGDASGPYTLSMTGDTGGEFRMFRRTFPFHATLTRTSEATCKLEKPVS
jgi:hypothetical protein